MYFRTLILFSIAMPLSAQNVVRSQRGDTTVIKTTGNGLWGAPHELAIVKRISGTSPQTEFGQIGATAATPDGGVLIFDIKAAEGPILRQFDAEGRFVRNIGRKGEGPGEYRGLSVTLVVAPDGVILLRDFPGTLIRYSPEGKFLSVIRLEIGGGGAFDIHPGPLGSVYVRKSNPPGVRVPYVSLPLMKYDASGKIVDSLFPRTFPTADRAPGLWRPVGDGTILFSAGTWAGFIAAKPGTRTLRTEVPMTGAAYDPGERKELEAYNEWRAKTAPAQSLAMIPITAIPERKLVSSGVTMVDFDGRVWISRPTTGVVGEERVLASGSGPNGPFSFKGRYQSPPAYLAFKLDGTYLGEIHFPVNATHIAFAKDFAWGFLKGPDDEPQLIKWRLTPEGR